MVCEVYLCLRKHLIPFDLTGGLDAYALDSKGDEGKHFVLFWITQIRAERV